MPEESAASDESWRAVAPLAIVPAAVAAALVWPGPIEPRFPLETAPAATWLGLIVAGLAPGATVVLARRVLLESGARSRALRLSASAALALTWVAAGIALLLAPAMLIHGGVVRILAGLAVAGFVIAAAAAILLPHNRATWGAVVAEAILALAVFLAAGAPRSADEELRSAMLLAPGWGENDLGTIALRWAANVNGNPRYEEQLVDESRRLAELTSGDAFAQPVERRWADDALAVRGWLTIWLSESDRVSPADRAQMISAGTALYLDFARDESASLEPYTANSPVGTHALAETSDLHAPEAVRMRIWLAWESLRLLGSLPGDSPEQQQAEELVRSIYQKERLDLEGPSGDIYFATFTFRRQRLIEKGDAAAFLAYFDALANDSTLPLGTRKAFEHETTFVRAHPEDGYRAVMALLATRYASDPRDALQAVLTKWPDSSVAVEAQKDLMSLAAAPAPSSPEATP